MATAFVWDGTENAWDSNHWGRGGVNPIYPGHTGSSVGDTIEIDASVDAPTSTPANPLTVAEYVCYGGDFDCGEDLTVTDVLRMGTEGGADAPVFSGTASPGCKVLFQGGAFNVGTVGNNAVFADGAVNSDDGGAVGDNATFNDTATNGGTAGDNATFNDQASNAGTVGVGATFNGSGAVAGTVDDGATFNTSGELTATLAGTAYTFMVLADLHSCKFSGEPPVIFTLATATAGIVGPILESGGEPIAFSVVIADQPDLLTDNIVYRKTILGVNGDYGAGRMSGASIGPYPVFGSIGAFPVEE